MAARPSALHVMTPEQARAQARRAAFVGLRFFAYLALIFGLVRVAGLPTSLGFPLFFAARATWWALKRYVLVPKVNRR